MDCIICKSATQHFLTKKEFLSEYAPMVEDIAPYQYSKCTNCGFTQCDTIINLEKERWLKLNYDFHHYLENNAVPTNQPPYAAQAMMIRVLEHGSIIDFSKPLDFAGGYGTLSKILNDFYHLELPVYDPYVTSNKYKVRYITDPQAKASTCVINSALFEHIVSKETLNEIDRLVADNGTLIIHTVICETIPQKENWFYFDPPVHSAFHTNKSMSFFMEEYKYESSLYCPSAKCWVLFRKDSPAIAAYVESINELLQTDYFHYKKGFVDYWKGF
ncbi:methyltransferase domain-containing protein [soil metagenome]